MAYPPDPQRRPDAGTAGQGLGRPGPGGGLHAGRPEQLPGAGPLPDDRSQGVPPEDGRARRTGPQDPAAEISATLACQPKSGPSRGEGQARAKAPSGRAKAAQGLPAAAGLALRRGRAGLLLRGLRLHGGEMGAETAEGRKTECQKIQGKPSPSRQRG